MEVSVFMSLDAMLKNQSVFKRQVLCPDVFDIDSFVLSMKGIFGEKVVIQIIIT